LASGSNPLSSSGSRPSLTALRQPKVNIEPLRRNRAAKALIIAWLLATAVVLYRPHESGFRARWVQMPPAMSWDTITKARKAAGRPVGMTYTVLQISRLQAQLITNAIENMRAGRACSRIANACNE
jgi:hypothetical protein